MKKPAPHHYRIRLISGSWFALIFDKTGTRLVGKHLGPYGGIAECNDAAVASGLIDGDKGY